MRGVRNVPTDVWKFVDVGKPDDCWPWLGACNSKGYGQMRVNGRMFPAHRVAYVASHDVHPGDLCVLHRCDNPPCCNPAHLFLGTRADNARDCVSKGRTLRGEKHPRSKLTTAQVSAISERRAAGERGIDLAAEFGVTAAMVSYIHLGKNWSHV